jgi:hypothetical protein
MWSSHAILVGSRILLWQRDSDKLSGKVPLEDSDKLSMVRIAASGICQLERLIMCVLLII